MNLLLARDGEREGQRLVLRGARAKHLRSVLKVEPGQSLRVAIARERVGQGVVASVSEDAVVIELAEMSAVSEPAVRLILALPRPKALRKTLQTVASFGVAHIDLVNAWRVDKSYWGSPVLEDAALQEELYLGCEQGRQAWLPTITCHRLLRPYLEALPPAADGCARVLAHPGVSDHLDAFASQPALQLAIGPEGGWIESELESFSQCGFGRVSLGDAILRSEIALASALGQWQLLRAMASSSSRE